MKLGYNTNGLAFHRWPEAIELIAEMGFESVAITVDHHCLDPYSTSLNDELARMRERLDQFGLMSVIETGARYLLNPRVKHEPTLMSVTRDDRAKRIDFLSCCIHIAAELDSEAVSFWSGILREDLSESAGFARLSEGCQEVVEKAAKKDVKLAFEPEPGMFIESFDQYQRLLETIDAPHFGLTIDIGHVQCVEENPIPVYLREWKDRLFNIHIEDMKRGVHEHLRFGEGEIEFEPVFSTLNEIGYAGPVNVELSRHSHMAPEVMHESFQFMQELKDRFQ